MPGIRLAERARAAIGLLLCGAGVALPATTAAAEAERRFSASPAELLESAARIDAGSADILTLSADTEIRFDSEGRASQVHYVLYKVVTAQGAQAAASASAAYSPWIESRPQIRARVITMDGQVHELDSSTLTDSSVGALAPEIFSDQRVVLGPLPAIAAGALVEQEVRTSETQSMQPFGNLYAVRFGSTGPVVRQSLIVETPAELPLHLEIEGLPGLLRERSEHEGRLRHRFVQQGLDPIPMPEASAPADVVQWPRVVLSTGASWRETARAYSEVVERRIADADMAEFVRKAGGTGAGRAEIIDSLVRQLHGQVRYTGVEFGASSVFPQAPAETLRRKYGDCKDKSTLLVAMLRAAGIPAHLVLLAAEGEEASLARTPGLGGFDHAIVHVPGEHEYWIDAVAEYSRPTSLPGVDQGRLALIVRPETDGLVRTPELPANENRIIETRTVDLGSQGRGRFVAHYEAHGNTEATLRALAATADPVRRQFIEAYTLREFHVRNPDRVEFPDPRDFSVPYRQIVEVSGSELGETDLFDARVSMPIMGFLQRMPPALLLHAAAGSSQAGGGGLVAGTSTTGRRNDLVFDAPFVHEWHYRIRPPLGFVVREAPQDGEVRFGPATLTTRFHRELRDGVLEGVFRFESGKRRWTPDEVDAFAVAVTRWHRATAARASFTLGAAAQLRAGKLREGIAEIDRLVSANPQEPLYRLVFAHALLGAGVGEAAREQADEALRIDPQLAIAHSTRALVLSHDLVGRPFGRGLDLQGARASYEKAIELAPDDDRSRGAHAALLEFSAGGERYGPGADVAGALREYDALGDRLAGLGMGENPLYLLANTGGYAELVTRIRAGPRTANHAGLLVAGIAMTDGVDAALGEAAKLPSQGSARGTALALAGELLTGAAHYEQARSLLEAAVDGSEHSAQSAARAAMLRGVRSIDPASLDQQDPGDFVRYFTVLPLAGVELSDAALARYLSPLVLPADKAARHELIDRLRATLRETSARMMQRGGRMFRDFLLSQARIETEYDGVNSYRVRMTLPHSAPQFYVAARYDGELRMIGGPGEIAGLGHEALARLDAGDERSARRMLDWARDMVPPVRSESADPLDAASFARLWSRGREATALEIRFVAAAAIAGGANSEAAIPLLARMAADPPGGVDRSVVDCTLASAYWNSGNLPEFSRVAARIRDAHPLSLRAFSMSSDGMYRQGLFAEAEALAHERLRRLPDDLHATRYAAKAANARGDGRKALDMQLRLIDAPAPQGVDLNTYAWLELVNGLLSERGIEAAEQSVFESRNDPGGELHTLAVAYAEQGRIAEARANVLQYMAASGLSEPDAASWYVFGRIAEQLGLHREAVAAYRRVDRPAHDWKIPDSTHRMAERRLAALNAGARSEAR